MSGFRLEETAKSVAEQLRIEANLLDERAQGLWYLGPQFDRLITDLRGKANRIRAFAEQLSPQE